MEHDSHGDWELSGWFALYVPMPVPCRVVAAFGVAHTGSEIHHTSCLTGSSESLQ